MSRTGDAIRGDGAVDDEAWKFSGIREHCLPEQGNAPAEGAAMLERI